MNLNVPATDPAGARGARPGAFGGAALRGGGGAFEAAAADAERPRARAGAEARPRRAGGRPAGGGRGAAHGLVDGGAGFKVWAAAAGLLARCPVETWPGVRHRLRAGLVGTWTTDTFAPLLRLAAARHGIALDISQPPFGQYFNATLDPGSELLATAPEVLVLAPDHRALGFRAFSDTPAEDVAAELDRWGGVWAAVRRVASPTWCSSVSPPPAATRWATMAPGSRARRSIDRGAERRARRAGGGGGRGLSRRRRARGAGRRGGLLRPARLVHGEDPLRAGGAAGPGAACRGGARRPARAVAPGAGARPRQHALGRRDRRRRRRRHRARQRRRGRGLRRLPGGAQDADAAAASCSRSPRRTTPRSRGGRSSSIPRWC